MFPQYVEQESPGKTFRVMRLGGSLVAVMIGESMNCLDNSQKRLMICSEIINLLKTM
jgi:surface antigen